MFPDFYQGDVMCSVLTDYERACAVLIPFYSDDMETFLKNHDRPLIPWVIALPTELWEVICEKYPPELMRNRLVHMEIEPRWQGMVILPDGAHFYKPKTPIHFNPTVVHYEHPSVVKYLALAGAKACTKSRRAEHAPAPAKLIDHLLVRFAGLDSTVFDPLADEHFVAQLCVMFGLPYCMNEPDLDKCRRASAQLSNIRNAVSNIMYSEARLRDYERSGKYIFEDMGGVPEA
jgi:hypothetical protein